MRKAHDCCYGGSYKGKPLYLPRGVGSEWVEDGVTSTRSLITEVYLQLINTCGAMCLIMVLAHFIWRRFSARHSLTVPSSSPSFAA